MYAVVRIGGSQFKITPEETLLVPRLPAEVGATVALDQVLLLSGEGNVTPGTPTVPGARVEAEVLAHELGPKVRIFKMKRRKGYRRTTGHRQPLTRVRVLRVVAP